MHILYCDRQESSRGIDYRNGSTDRCPSFPPAAVCRNQRQLWTGSIEMVARSTWSRSTTFSRTANHCCPRHAVQLTQTGTLWDLKRGRLKGENVYSKVRRMSECTARPSPVETPRKLDHRHYVRAWLCQAAVRPPTAIYQEAGGRMVFPRVRVV